MRSRGPRAAHLLHKPILKYFAVSRVQRQQRVEFAACPVHVSHSNIASYQQRSDLLAGRIQAACRFTRPCGFLPFLTLGEKLLLTVREALGRPAKLEDAA